MVKNKNALQTPYTPLSCDQKINKTNAFDMYMTLLFSFLQTKSLYKVIYAVSLLSLYRRECLSIHICDN